MKKIHDTHGNLIEGDSAIAEEGIKFYRNQFQQEKEGSDFHILNHIPEMVSEEDNAKLCSIPLVLEELRNTTLAWL